MPVVTIVVGSLLSILGILGFLLGTSQSLTALLPLAFGTVLEGCGLLAMQPRYKMHAMHGASIVALLGVLGSVMGVASFIRWLGGAELARPLGAQMQTAMFMICAVFLALCVRSFRAARAARHAAV